MRGRRTERTQSTWRDPTVEAHRRKEKAFPPPCASSLSPPLLLLLKSHRSEAPQDCLSLGGRPTLPSLPVLIFVRLNNKFVLSLRVYVRPQYQYPSIMYRIYLQRQNRQLFPTASVTPPPPLNTHPPSHTPTHRFMPCLHFSFRITATTQPKQLH